VRIRARLLLALLLVAAASAAPAVAQQPALTILHTNDTHGHLLPFSYPDSVGAMPDARGMPLRDIGGIARRATLVKRLRQQLARNATKVWLVDVGDYSDGTPFSTEYKGEADVAAMNAAGYDLGTLGNHEFNHPAAQVRKLIGATKYRLVLANAVDRRSGRHLLPPFVVERVGPVRVGVFGLITREAATYPAGKEAFDVKDEIQAAREVVEALRGQADIIVLLSHAGEAMDRRLASEVPDIDVIVGGHSHSRLRSGDFLWGAGDPRGTDVDGTILVQAHQWGGELGRLDLVFRRNGGGRWRVDRALSFAGLLPVTADIPEDPGVTAVVSRFWKPIAGTYGEVLGQAEDEFVGRGDDLAEYNLFADAIRETFGADFGMENTGGIRAPMLRGPVTRGDLATMDPFDNTVVRFKATGRQIRQLLERYTPAVSALRYRVEGKKLTEVSIAGQPLDDERVYSGVTNSYFAGFALKGLEFEDTRKPRLDTVVEYIRAKGTIRPLYDGRRVVVPEPR
jgi:2',3'-cyclic-nucleotide 2'-phosphodiesterase (5'-nucleotidase family)